MTQDVIATEDLLVTVKARLLLAGLLTMDYLTDYNFTTPASILMPVSIDEATRLVKHHLGATVKIVPSDTIPHYSPKGPMMRAHMRFAGSPNEHRFTSDDPAFAIIVGSNLCYLNSIHGSSCTISYFSPLHKLLLNK